MGAIIITSSAAHSRIRHARAWLDTRSPAEEILILAATADAGNELARDLAQIKGAAFGWHRLSLAQFAAVLAAPLLATRGLVTLGDLGVQAICARVVHRLTGDSALGRYSEIAAGPGFARALSRVVTDLRLARVDPDAVGTVAPDLKPLFEAYETSLADGGFTDWAGVLATATAALMTDSFTHPLISLPTILLDIAVTSEAELSFVRALSLRTPELLVIAPAADPSSMRAVPERRRGCPHLTITCSYPIRAHLRRLVRLDPQICGSRSGRWNGQDARPVFLSGEELCEGSLKAQYGRRSRSSSAFEASLAGATDTPERTVPQGQDPPGADNAANPSGQA